MSYAYSSLLSPFHITSGIAERVYLAPVRWFANNGIAIPQEPFTTPGDRVRILTDHAFADLCVSLNISPGLGKTYQLLDKAVDLCYRPHFPSETKRNVYFFAL